MNSPSTIEDFPRGGFLWWGVFGGLIALGLHGFFAGTSFTQDDFVWLFLSKLCPTPADIFFRDALCGQFFRPLGQLWYVTVHWLGHGALLPFQVAYLGLHLLNSLLVGCLVSRLDAARTGTMAALFFAINGMFVAPISNYYCYVFDLLGFGFYLLTLLLLWRAWRQTSWLAGSASLATALGAYLSKEAYFTLPGAIVLVSGISVAGEAWDWRMVQRRQRWFWIHLAILGVALSWRWMIIGNFGGYGWASTATPSGWLAQVSNRAATFSGFAGWSLIPNFAHWGQTSLWLVLVSVVLLSGLTVWAWRLKVRPLWPWAWMVCTWTPSMLMVTHSPVSWYAPCFGTILLLAQVLARYRLGHWIGLAIGLYYAIFGHLSYAQRTPEITRLRTQQESLRKLFPLGGRECLPRERIVLLRSSPDLFPDAIVKYGTPIGSPVADVLFLNGSNPINWVITNEEGPGDIQPLIISPDYQTGFVDMHQYRAYALEMKGRQAAILRRGPPFRFLQWEPNGSLTDVTSQNPMRK